MLRLIEYVLIEPVHKKAWLINRIPCTNTVRGRMTGHVIWRDAQPGKFGLVLRLKPF